MGGSGQQWWEVVGDSFIPGPTHALLLVFPVNAAYTSHRLAEDATLPEYQGKGEDEPVVWFKQTIKNACGLMGLLHAVSNGGARTEVGKFWMLLFFSFFFWIFKTSNAEQNLIFQFHSTANKENCQFENRRKEETKMN